MFLKQISLLFIYSIQNQNEDGSYSGVLTSSPICLTFVKTFDTLFRSMISKLKGFPDSRMFAQTLLSPCNQTKSLVYIKNSMQLMSTMKYKLSATNYTKQLIFYLLTGKICF